MGLVSDRRSDEAAAAALVAELRSINADLGMPTPAAFGIDPDAFRTAMPSMARQALASGSPQNNPRVPDQAEIERIYEQLLTG
jgi:alcohol dehydrogenase class IV